MDRIKRATFLRMGAVVMLIPFQHSFLGAAETPKPGKDLSLKDKLFQRLLIANDQQVTILLQPREGRDNFSRKLGYDFSCLSASFCIPDSKYFHSPSIVSALEKITGLLLTAQSEDGTVNIGNLESPPDTAFLIELLTAGTLLLKNDNAGTLKTINSDIKKFLIKSGDALAVGGIHTPNHRWVVSAALARLHALYPNKKYTARVEEWLAEGVFIDKDGHYPERSGIYSGVENTALITIGRLLNKPGLFAPVRKNLEMMYYYMEPNGDLVTTDSRRQDQYMSKDSKDILSYYLQYRFLAIRENNHHFAGIAAFIETLPGFEKQVLNKALFHFLEDPLLLQPLPAASPPPVKYEKLFTTSHLLRIRTGNTSATLFGGVDWPIIIASGRSNSPNFFSYRKGKAVLKYLRLSTSFFSMGYFYSEGIKKESNKYILHKKLEIPYYQPLPTERINKAGDYKLSPSIDDRFWNKMDFENRPVSNLKTLETTITFLEENGEIELSFQITGQAGVSVTIELCFPEGGKLSGVTMAGDGNHFLEKDRGQYENGGDTIRFGPGISAHHSIDGLEGERYSTHFGTLRTAGLHVYLTGVTPFNHTLNLS